MDEIDWARVSAPTLAEFDALAQETFARLPPRFRERCGGVVIRVEEFADEETLAAMGVEDPFSLSGLYQGVDLLSETIDGPAPAPPMVFLYRRPLLDEWAEGEMSLGALIRHVIVHEIGHHFGFSDADMERIEEEAGD